MRRARERSLGSPDALRTGYLAKWVDSVSYFGVNMRKGSPLAEPSSWPGVLFENAMKVVFQELMWQ